MQLGKFSSDRDSALHYLCTAEWSTGSFGDVEAPTGYVWRISNTWEDVKPQNTEFTSVLEEWLEQQGDVTDSEEFRRSLVGHYLLREDSRFVHVLEFESMAERDAIYSTLSREYDEWLGSEDDV